MVQQARIRWDGLGHSPKYTILNFDVPESIAAAAGHFGNFLEAINFAFVNTMSWTFESEYRTLDENTGALLGIHNLPDPPSGGPGIGSSQLADATQILLRWNTGTVVAGRQLKGRTFLPGIAASEIAAGNLRPSSVTAIQTAIDSYTSTYQELGVWSRKHGIMQPVTSGSVWTEFAVQRRRRG